MADWPDTAELARVLDVDPQNGDEWQDILDRVMAAAIFEIKSTIGNWQDTDEPTEGQAQAALRMAELMALRPEAAAAVGTNDPTVMRLLKGTRRRFGIA